MARRESIDRVLKSLGERLVGFWCVYGDIDPQVVGELPGNLSATAFGMRVSSSGPVRARTVMGVTPEEFDGAHAIPVDFRPTGPFG